MSPNKDLLIATISLGIGILIYITCRSNIWAIDLIGLGHLSFQPKYGNNILFYVFIYSLPDALWYLSLLLLQIQFYHHSIMPTRILWWCSVALPFIMEILQAIHFVPGTYDIYDIIFYLLVFIIVISDSPQTHLIFLVY